MNNTTSSSQHLSSGQFLPAWLLRIPPEVLLLLVWLVARVITSFDGLYGQDSYAYLEYAARVREAVRGGPPPGPFFWPPGYAGTGGLLGLSGLPLPALLQGLSLAGWLLTTFFTRKLIALVYPANPIRRNLFVLLFWGLAPIALRSSLQVMSDAWGIALLTGGLYFAVRYAFGTTTERQAKTSAKSWHPALNLVLANLLMGMAFLVRFAFALPIAAGCLLLLWGIIRRRSWQDQLLAVLSAGLIVSIVFLTGLLEGSQLLGHESLAAWSPGNMFKAAFETEQGQFQYAFPNGLFVLQILGHPGFCMAGLLFLGLTGWLYFSGKLKVDMGENEHQRASQRAIPLAPWLPIALVVLPYLIFLAGIPQQNIRFLLPMLPWVLLLYFPAWNWLCDNLGRLGIPVILNAGTVEETSSDSPEGEDSVRWDRQPALQDGQATQDGQSAPHEKMPSRSSSLSLRDLLGLAVIIAVIQSGLAIRGLKPSLQRVEQESIVANDLKLLELPPDQKLYTIDLTGALRHRLPGRTVVELWDSVIPPPQNGDLMIFNETAFLPKWQGKPILKHWTSFQPYLKPAKQYPDGWTIYRYQASK